MIELICWTLVGMFAWALGYWVGKSNENDKATIDRIERKIAAHDAAELADTPEAWDVFDAAFPKETMK